VRVSESAFSLSSAFCTPSAPHSPTRLTFKQSGRAASQQLCLRARSAKSVCSSARNSLQGTTGASKPKGGAPLSAAHVVIKLDSPVILEACSDHISASSVATAFHENLSKLVYGSTVTHMMATRRYIDALVIPIDLWLFVHKIVAHTVDRQLQCYSEIVALRMRQELSFEKSGVPILGYCVAVSDEIRHPPRLCECLHDFFTTKAVSEAFRRPP
jgi:hypothetical protein